MKNILRNTSIVAVTMIVVILCWLLPLPYGQVVSAAIDDGEYTINYEILKGDPKDDSTSLANGYWNKPATVIIKNGSISVRTEINKDAWVVEFATAQGNRFVDSKVISRNSDKDSRIVEFKVDSLEKDLVSTMTVDIPEQNYNHSYEARFRFYTESLTLVKSYQDASGNDNKSTQPEQAATPAPTSAAEQPAATATAAPIATTAPSNEKANEAGSKAVIEPSESAQATAKPNSQQSEAGEHVRAEVDNAAASDDSSNSSGSASSEEKQSDDQSATNEQNASSLEAEDEQAQLDEVMTNAAATQDETSVEDRTGATFIDDEVKRGGTSSFIIIVVIGVLFIAGFVVWFVSQNKRKQ